MEKTSEKGQGRPGIVSPMMVVVMVVVVVVVVYDYDYDSYYSHLHRDTNLWWRGCIGG